MDKLWKVSASKRVSEFFKDYDPLRSGYISSKNKTKKKEIITRLVGAQTMWNRANRACKAGLTNPRNGGVVQVNSN